LPDAFQIEPALFRLQRQLRVEFRDDGRVGQAGFPDVRVDAAW
jgi:hypothetical protein